MRKLLIVGAGGFGRALYQLTIDLQDRFKEWDYIGFLDDNINALDNYNLSDKFTGTIADYTPSQDEYIICAIGEPITRTRICHSLLEKGASFFNMLHPQAFISRGCTIGNGVIILPGAYIFPNSKVKDFAVINTLTAIGHDSTVGEGCVLSAQCDVMGFVCLEDEVFLGSGARILPGIHVHKRARVGAGSVVIRDVKEGISVFGNPAKPIYNPKLENET